MKKIFMRMDKSLLFTCLFFFIFGLIMILSASSMESYMRYGYSPYNYFIKQGIFLIAGFFLFMFLILLPSGVIKKLSPMFMLVIIFVLGGLFAFGSIAKGAKSWIQVGGFKIQPGEFAKVISILFLGYYYDKFKDSLNSPFKIIIPIIPCIIVFVLIAIQPDMGTACILALICFFIFYSIPVKNNARNKINMLLVVFVIIGIIGGVLFKDKIFHSYQVTRFNFFDPCLRYQEESGYQLCNSFIAFSNGKISGKGIGMSTQKYLYLPESYTDFIFPIIVEELGMIVGVIILCLYFFIVIKLFLRAKKVDNLYSSIVLYGTSIYIFIHVFVNLIGVMGLGPLTGVPLPFLSYGGSYTLSLIILLGICERLIIDNNRDVIKKRVLKK